LKVDSRLVLVKALHTAVWAFMAACILAIYAFAGSERFVPALAMIAIVAVEVAVLLANRMTCPLTPIAARYTDDRRPNFDIYLPQWLAKHNKAIFGPLYVLGALYTLWAWLHS
jgi:hypothetical protein